MNEETLRHGLTERYNAIHIIRDRIERTTFWVLGFYVLATGWVIQTDYLLSIADKIFLIIFSVLLAILFYAYFLKDLERGFTGQMRVASILENELGFFDGEESVYPKTWKIFEQKEKKEGFYLRNNRAILIGANFFLVLTIILKDCIIF